jgi:hypothetical protein
MMLWLSVRIGVSFRKRRRSLEETARRVQSGLLLNVPTYKIGDSGQTLNFSDSVLAQFKRHQQRRLSVRSSHDAFPRALQKAEALREWFDNDPGSV